MTDGISELRREQREEEEARSGGRRKQPEPEPGSATAGAPSIAGKRRRDPPPTDWDAAHPYVRVKLLLRTGPNAATDPVVALRDDAARVLEDVFMLDAAATFRAWADDLLDAQH